LQIGLYYNASYENIIFDNVSVKEYLGQSVVPDSGCGSWLFEPQSTNLFTYSEDFSQWVKSGNAVVSDGFAISPDGNINASKFTFDGTSQGRIEDAISVTNGVPYTFSVWLKNDNLSDPTKVWIGLSTTTQGKFVTVTNVWKRFIITSTSNGTLEYPRVQTSEVGSIFAWGAQLEQQSYATSYIPSNGSTVTRNQDLCTNGGSLASINSTEGVLYAEIAALADDLTNRYITISNGGDSYIRLTYTTTSNQLGARYYINGTFQTALAHILSDETEFIKVSFKWKENDFALWVNGTEVATDTSGLVNAPNTFNRLEFQRYDGVFPFFGKTKALAVWKEALSDSELQSLTTI